MENLTTPKAILFGFGLIALAIASVPYSSMLVKEAQASNIQRVQICGMVKTFGPDEMQCAGLLYAYDEQRATIKVSTKTD